jgi:hypothetical protein
MGFASQARDHFTLQINGKNALDFDVVLDDAEWDNAQTGVHMR